MAHDQEMKEAIDRRIKAFGRWLIRTFPGQVCLALFIGWLVVRLPIAGEEHAVEQRAAEIAKAEEHAKWVKEHEESERDYREWYARECTGNPDTIPKTCWDAPWRDSKYTKFSLTNPMSR
jgi:hypothetical protein